MEYLDQYIAENNLTSEAKSAKIEATPTKAKIEKKKVNTLLGSGLK